MSAKIAISAESDALAPSHSDNTATGSTWSFTGKVSTPSHPSTETGLVGVGEGDGGGGGGADPLQPLDGGPRKVKKIIKKKTIKQKTPPPGVGGGGGSGGGGGVEKMQGLPTPKQGGGGGPVYQPPLTTYDSPRGDNNPPSGREDYDNFEKMVEEEVRRKTLSEIKRIKNVPGSSEHRLSMVSAADVFAVGGQHHQARFQSRGQFDEAACEKYVV